MKIRILLFTWIFLCFSPLATASIPMEKRDACLTKMLSKNNFDSLPGYPDPLIVKKLESTFKASLNNFIESNNNGATKELFLKLLGKEISRFDRDPLDTEDAEGVADNFERIMDCVNLESSGGILNNWMYGEWLGEKVEALKNN